MEKYHNMKYLRSVYESTEQQLNTEKLCSPYVNWNLIKDIEEMSLEYLDYDYTLRIFLFIDDNTALYISNSHDVKTVRWSKNQFQDVEDKTIEYEITLFKKNDNISNNIDYDKTNELLSIIKQMYPDEKIS